jgi:hypothetical protein
MALLLLAHTPTVFADVDRLDHSDCLARAKNGQTFRLAEHGTEPALASGSRPAVLSRGGPPNV